MPNYRIKRTPKGPVVGSYFIRPKLKITGEMVVELNDQEVGKTHAVDDRKLMSVGEGTARKTINQITQTRETSLLDYLEQTDEPATHVIDKEFLGVRTTDDGKQRNIERPVAKKKAKKKPTKEATVEV